MFKIIYLEISHVQNYLFGNSPLNKCMMMVTTKVGGNRKECPGKAVEVVWACDEKSGTLRKKEGDGNENTRKGREEDLREDGWTK